MKREARAAENSGTGLDESALGGVSSDTIVRGDDARAYCDALGRRRAASHRLEPLGDGRRDPWARPVLGQRSTFGLSRAALLAEARRLRDEGWQGWEIERVLELGRGRLLTPNERAVAALFDELERSA